MVGQASTRYCFRRTCSNTSTDRPQPVVSRLNERTPTLGQTPPMRYGSRESLPTKTDDRAVDGVKPLVLGQILTDSQQRNNVQHLIKYSATTLVVDVTILSWHSGERMSTSSDGRPPLNWSSVAVWCMTVIAYQSSHCFRKCGTYGWMLNSTANGTRTKL